MKTWFHNLRRAARSRRSARLRRRPLVVENLDQRCMLDAGMGYIQTNLASNIRGLARHLDSQLVNPWGFSETADGQFRISANGTGTAPLLNAQGRPVGGRAVVLPAPPSDPAGTDSTPNGNLVNTTGDFVISRHGRSAPASVLFSTEDGTIIGFNPKIDRRAGIIGADLSSIGAIFKLLAAGTVNGKNYLYATDFHNGVVDVFDKDFHLVNLGGSFSDPDIPAGFAPFGIKNIDNVLFVTYAKQDADREDDVAGLGNGFIDEFTLTGQYIERFASQGDLNSPIGMAVAPDNFGQFSNALLVGNFGDSHVNAFDLATGQFLGQLTDANGAPLVLNGGVSETDTAGLWGIGFGNGRSGTPTNTLFFAAGIHHEQDGLFGSVTVNGEDFGANGIAVKAPHFYEDYVGPKLAELNAVAVAGELLPNGSFDFIGVNQGRIDPNTRATFVFGVDRNGKLSPGPFPGRPDIRFDVVIVVKLAPGLTPSASVVDLANHTTTPLPASSLRVAGNVVAVNVPGNLLPSTGLPPSQYRFNYWPEDGLPGSSHIASFAPEFNDIQVGTISGFAAARVAGLPPRLDNVFMGVLDGGQHGRHRRNMD